MGKELNDSVLHISGGVGYRLGIYAAKRRTSKKAVANKVLGKFLDKEERKETKQGVEQ